MEAVALENEPATVAAKDAEDIYYGMLRRKWNALHPRFGLSTLSSIGALATLASGGLTIAAATEWHALPATAVGVAIGAMVLGLILCQALNGRFMKLEKQAFEDLELQRTPRSSPFGAAARLVMLPRARAKHAWVEKRMRAFRLRREQNERRAEIFERQRVKLGSIHGSTSGSVAPSLLRGGRRTAR